MSHLAQDVLHLYILMNPKKLFIILAWALVAFILSKVLTYYVEGTTPNVINDMINSRESNPNLELILGGYVGFESKYNENDFQKDTLSFKLTFFGRKKNISINALAKKQAEFRWRLIRADTTYFTR